MAASDWLRAAAALIDAVSLETVATAAAKNPRKRRGAADPHAAQLAGAAFARNPVPPSTVKQGTELYESFTGHTPQRQRIRDAGRALGLPIKDGRKIPLVAFGELTEVRYRTIRDGEEEFYRHPFRASSRPLLAARHDGKRIYIVGGRYRFTDRGIVDQ